MYFGCVSYCPIFYQFVESFTDFGEAWFEGAIGVIQLRQQLGVRVMVEDMVNATVRFWGEVGVDQLQQQIPAVGQEVCHHCLVEGKVHLR